MNAFPYRVFISVLLISISLLSACGEKSVDGGNRPPAIPSNPVPADGASGVELDALLSWQCTDPDGDRLGYDIYFGVETDPPLIQQDLDTTVLNLARLGYDSVYYWKVVAKDSLHETSGPVWSFATIERPELRLTGTYELSRSAYNIWVSDRFVYLACISRLLVIDASDPASPLLASELVTEPDDCVSDVAVQDNVAYLAMCTGGLQLYDVSNPYALIHLGGYPWPDTGEAKALAVRDNYVYVVDGYFGNLRVIEVSDPANPSLISVSDRPHSWEGLNNVCVTGDFAYVVVGVTMPGDPDLIGVIDMVDISNPHTVNLFSGGDTFYEILSKGNYLFLPGRGSGNLKILDIADPLNPVEVSSYSSPGGFEDSYILGDYVFITVLYSGVQMIDVSDPESPSFVAEYAESGWWMEIYAEEDYVYVTKFDDRLYILELVY
jgi:hypothetical protein